MTHEEAARYLDEFKDAFHGGDLETAMEMGAESLRRDVVRMGEVTTTGYATSVEYPCEDAVSREYLLSLAKQDGAYDYVDAKQIADAPSVQPVKTGHWIKKPVKQYCPSDAWYPPPEFFDTWNEQEGYWLEDELFCSACNEQPPEGIEWKFCPYCGTKMVEPQESEESV